MLYQLHRLLFLGLANRDSEETWTLQKQTLVVGETVEPREGSWGEEMMQIHPCPALALLSPFSLCLHGVCHYIFLKWLLVQSTSDWRRRRGIWSWSYWSWNGHAKMGPNAEAWDLSNWVGFLCGSGGTWRVCGRIFPCSQDQWGQMVPRSSAGMDGFPQAGMMCEGLGKAVVGCFSQNCPKCLLFASSLTAEFQRQIFLLSDVS